MNITEDDPIPAKKVQDDKLIDAGECSMCHTSLGLIRENDPAPEFCSWNCQDARKVLNGYLDEMKEGK